MTARKPRATAWQDCKAQSTVIEILQEKYYQIDGWRMGGGVGWNSTLEAICAAIALLERAALQPKRLRKRRRKHV